MGKADERKAQEVSSFLERQKLEFTTTEEQSCDKLTVRSGSHIAHVSVYNTGAIVIGGKDSPLKSLLAQMKPRRWTVYAWPAAPL